MKRKEEGFTLIELLVVVAIIGILAAIAIPQFSAYRQRGFDARSVSDLRNAANGEEAYFADNETYADCDETDCDTTLPGVQLSDGVDITMTAVAGPPESFTGCSFHPNGSRNAAASGYGWDSAAGGLDPTPGGGGC